MRRILIVDDEPSVKHSLADAFEDRDWEVLTAENTEDSLALCEEFPPDAAIVDIRLPGLDGNEFIRRACSIAPCAVFVICTGSREYVLPDDLRQLSCVCPAIFTKPIEDMDQLEKKILLMMDHR